MVGHRETRAVPIYVGGRQSPGQRASRRVTFQRRRFFATTARRDEPCELRAFPVNGLYGCLKRRSSSHWGGQVAGQLEDLTRRGASPCLWRERLTRAGCLCWRAPCA